jgi:hypothetical protein
VTEEPKAAKWLGRYEKPGRWFKGQLHVHTTVSDGTCDIPDTISGFRRVGFDFLCLTDHNVTSHAAALSADGFLVLDGIELDTPVRPGECIHTLCIDVREPVDGEPDYAAKLEAARRQGAFVVLAHPYWSGNSVEGLEPTFHAIEVYNDVCEKLNGKGGGLVHWERLIEKGHDVLAVAVDDCHWLARGHAGLGWIVARAKRLSRKAIMAALFAGEFYASTGPSFESIVKDGDTLTVRTSPVEAISLATLGPFAQRKVADRGELLGEAVFDLKKNDENAPGFPYRLVCRDAAGRFAWTNLLAR